MTVSTLSYARKRIASVLEEIERLKQSEFPYDHPRDCLDLLEKMFKNFEVALGKVWQTSKASVINRICSASLFEIYIYVPILGFILRSTNVRNAFEAYEPLLRLAQSILGNHMKLIVSSEWEYSPFTYRNIKGLKDFILIGLPAPESANPLLIPLAGHELGHSVWKTKKYSSKFEKRIEDFVLDELTDKRWTDYHSLHPHFKKEDLRGGLLAQPTWLPALTWASLQAEEIFCDFFGITLFAESYFHAFTYLISPGTPGQRALHYPSLARRVSHMVDAANKLEVKIPSGLESGIINETEPADPATKLLVSTADAASASIEPDLIKLAQEIATDNKIPFRNSENVKIISNNFRRNIAPISNSQSLTDICNAGWECALDPDLWKNVPQISHEEMDRMLKDIIIKSMEVSEICERLGEKR